VVVIERCNARYLDRTMIPEKVHVVTIDVSFISLALILPAVDRILDEGGMVLALLKPQFEIGKGKLGKGGVIRDEQARRDTVDQVRRTLEAQGWLWLDEMTSPIAGQKGNVEYVVRLRRGQTAVSSGEMRSIESRWA
jgi:23S rRNA (cytidine1920-2'-O)/16S rRNA (cytidine1409-2'-O)-methyltransferase